MELRDESGKLIDLTEVETNKEYIRKTYDRLEEKKKYKLSKSIKEEIKAIKETL